MIVKRFTHKNPPVQELPGRKLPLLITMSGRVEESLKENVARLDTLGVDENFAVLANKMYRDGIRSHAYRAYSVLNESPNKYNSVRLTMNASIKICSLCYGSTHTQTAKIRAQAIF